MLISECTSYKYLGIIFSQNLGDSCHIKVHLKDKATRLRGYMCSILSSHDDINRVSFGTSIWKSVILPTISHGCSVWLNDSKVTSSILKSIQYSVARAVMNIRCTPAMSAIIGELGWLPIQLILDRFRVKFFHRMMYDVPETRLCKQVFLALANNYASGMRSDWSYFDAIHTILKNVGLDRAFIARIRSGFSLS